MAIFRGRMQWSLGGAPSPAVALAAPVLVLTLVVALALTLAGCGRKTVAPAPVVEARKEQCPQPVASVERRMCQRERLWNVGYALRESNAPLCAGRTVLDDGVMVVSADTLDDMLSTVRWGDLGAFVEMRRWRDAYAREYGLDARHRVISVLRGSGGEEAGIRPGDVLTAVNGQPLPTGKLAARTLRWKVTKALGAGDTVTYTVERDGMRMDVPVRFHRLCDTVMDVEVRDSVDAFTTGQSIHVTLGFLEHFSDDADLAAVLSREMARHIRQPKGGGATSGAPGAVSSTGDRTDRPGVHGYYGMPPAGELARPEASGAAMLPREYDIDRLALFCMARAGYDHRRAGAAFEALAALPPSRRAVLQGEARPTPQRVQPNAQVAQADAQSRAAGLARAVAEIDARLAEGQPLIP